MRRTPASLTLAKLGLIVVALSILLGAALSHRANNVPASHPSAFLNEEEKVTPRVSVNNETWRIEWRIDQPNVKQHITLYQQISFQPGDRVTIQAGGCVQTGGSGKTWKRYVDPSGPNADRLYHGLVWIPGVIGGPAAKGVPPDLKRIAGYVNHTRLVPSGVKTAGFLSLGYEDDDYGDNGYWGHDDGTGDQCKGVGNAFVIITIERALPKGTWSGGTTAGIAGPYYFDKIYGLARVVAAGGGGSTGAYYCPCTNVGETCDIYVSKTAISCKPGPRGPYQAPGIPYCSGTCILSPFRE